MERQPGVTQWTALVGRTRERAALDALITAANPADRILVLRGEAGMGKSVLLDWAAERAAGAGVRVLRAVGVESESDLAFATLHQLLYPLLDRADSLAPAQRDALNQAFGVLEGRVPERFAISTAALALLQAVSREQRLLIVTDDVQWIDKSSALVLSFVLRRMGELPIAFLAATRGGWLSPLDLSAVRALEIPALEGGEAEQLLTAAHPGLAAEAARRILAEADGNPLALVELPRHLNRRQRSGREPLPPSLAMGEQLEHAFAGRLRSLPEVTRYSLLLAALGGRGPGGLRTIRAAAMKSWPGWTEDALDFADGSGLVRLDLHREEIVFRHPLVRSALVNMAPLVLLRGAHRALADALGDEPERQAWHLADAATGPDESVARALTDAAGRALNRGGAAEATAALSRAADLSPDAADRTRRRVDAAIAAVVGGQLEECAHLLRVTADDAMPVALAVRRATAAAFVMVYRDSDMEGVYREILPVLERIPPGEEHDSDFEDAYYTLFVACFWLGRPELWERLRRCLDRVSPLGKLCYAAAADPARTAHDVRRRIAPAAATLPLERRFWQVNWLVWTAHYVDGFGDHSALWRGLTERGAYTTHQFMTAARSYDVYLHGGWDEALAVAGEGVERARDLGYDFYARIFDYVAGLVAAGRGDEPERRRCADTLTDWARPRRLRLVLSEVAEIEIRAAMTRGAYDEAYTLASRQTPPGELPPFFPHFHRIFLDLVEAAVRCGHLAEARAHVAAGRAARMGEISAHHALLLATAAALVAPDDEAAAAFDAALALPEADRWPFEHARLQLAYGVWLRRHQDKGAARGQLRCAVETFRRLGAEPWADRAAEELRASGEVLGPRPAALAALLTAQETRIAELAAKGMTNREIGQLMHLSPRTVGAHLYKIFPKLGITSRVALRDSLLGMGAGH